jgi:hypothetical protein
MMPGGALDFVALLMARESSEIRAHIDRQHDLGEVGGAGRAEHAAAEALPDQARQEAAMVEVRMREHHRVERLGLERHRLPVALPNLLQSLKHAAVEQHLPVAHAQ